MVSCITIKDLIFLRKKPAILFLFCLFATQEIYGQNFTQVNQFPLQLSPSSAGSKEKKRISIGANAVNYSQNKTGAFSVSYDQMFKKIYAGAGVYYFQDYNNELVIPDSSIVPGKYTTQQSSKTIGFCIAPKYNIYEKKEYKKIKYTFSPSVFVELGTEQYKKTYNAHRIDYHSTIYSSDNPNGIDQRDSTVLNYNQYNFSNLLIRSGIGLLLNSENLILLSKICFSVTKCNDNAISNSTKDSSITRQNFNIKATSFIYSFEPTLHIGYTIRTHPNSNLSFTPILGIGIKHYFNFNLTSADSIEVYRYNISNADIAQCNYIHASANFRFKFLLLGFAYTKYLDIIHKGITVGYQSKNVKIMLTGATNLNKSKVAYSNLELTTGIFF